MDPRPGLRAVLAPVVFLEQTLPPRATDTALPATQKLYRYYKTPSPGRSFSLEPFGHSLAVYLLRGETLLTRPTKITEPRHGGNRPRKNARGRSSSRHEAISASRSATVRVIGCFWQSLPGPARTMAAGDAIARGNCHRGRNDFHDSFSTLSSRTFEELAAPRSKTFRYYRDIFFLTARDEKRMQQ